MSKYNGVRLFTMRGKNRRNVNVADDGSSVSYAVVGDEFSVPNLEDAKSIETFVEEAFSDADSLDLLINGVPK